VASPPNGPEPGQGEAAGIPASRTGDPAAEGKRSTFTVAANQLVDGVRRLRARFARRSNAIQTRSGADALAFKSTRSHWIVARSLCMYRCEEFAGVPRNRRDAAVALKLPVWSPFRNTGHHCVWSGTTAMVWFWDADTVAVQPELLEPLEPRHTESEPRLVDSEPRRESTESEPGHTRSASAIRTLPETVFYGKHDNGLRIQRCHEGVELQLWRDSVIQNSLWLPGDPEPRQVEGFLARHGADVGGAEIDAREVPSVASAFTAEPWFAPLTPQAWLVTNERTLVLAGLAIFVAVAVFQEARHWRFQFAASSVNAELQRLDADLTPVLASRNELAEITGRNAFLADILGTPSQALVMNRVDRRVPRESTEFRLWRYQQGDLTVVLADPKLDPVAVVSSIQQEPLFNDVRPGRSRSGGMEIKLQIDPARRSRTGATRGANP